MSDFTSQPYGSQTSSSQRRRRPRCPQCGSSRFRRDPSTSLVVCDSGHVLQGFRDEEAQDGDEYNNNRTQLHRRNLKRQGIDRIRRVGRKRQSVATRGVWYGARSRYLYFQTLQLILRLQIQALLQEMPGLPVEIEPICRDLWALYVSQKVGFIAQPILEQVAAEQSNDAAAESSNDAQFAARRMAQSERESILAQEWQESEELREQLRDVGVFEEQDELAGQSDATERRATSSEWESALEQESEDEDDKNLVLAPKKRRRKRKNVKQTECGEGKVLQRKGRDDLEDLLSVLHLGLITLRVPIAWTDLCTLIKAGKLPYLHVVHHLPSDMVAYIPAREVRKLDPSRVPSVQKLHRRTVALATDLYDAFGIEFPELNSLPLLVRFVERMLLPPTFYAAAKTLLNYISIPMHTVPLHSAASLHGPEEEEEEEERYQRSMPPNLDARLSVNLGSRSTAKEIIIMASIVILAKMRFGLDGEERHESFEDPMVWSGAPSLPEWLESLKEHEKQLQNDHRALYDAESVDVLDMDETQLDAYLAYAERSLILSQRPAAYQWRRRDALGDLLSCAPHLNDTFPLDEDATPPTVYNGSTLGQKNDFVHEKLINLYEESPPRIPPYITLSTNQSRPGDAHSVYSPRESSQSFHPDYRQVLHHASRIVGCLESDMADTVQAVELGLIKMLVWRRKRREETEKQRQRQQQGVRKPGRPRRNGDVPRRSRETSELNMQD